MPWRGGPTVSASNDFADLNRGDWYADAVSWATANGVVSGMGKGMFGPNAPLTREQLALILSGQRGVGGCTVGSKCWPDFWYWRRDARPRRNCNPRSGGADFYEFLPGQRNRISFPKDGPISFRTVWGHFLGMQFRMDMNVYVPSAQSVLTRLDYQYASPFISFALTGGDSSV